jgi:hypothetical protein
VRSCKVISNAFEINKDLLIFIDMPGGKLENLDEICTALRTYQSVPKQFNKNQQKMVLH